MVGYLSYKGSSMIRTEGRLRGRKEARLLVMVEAVSLMGFYPTGHRDRDARASDRQRAVRPDGEPGMARSRPVSGRLRVLMWKKCQRSGLPRFGLPFSDHSA